jgi:hypothetical protein
MPSIHTAWDLRRHLHLAVLMSAPAIAFSKVPSFSLFLFSQSNYKLLLDKREVDVNGIVYEEPQLSDIRLKTYRHILKEGAAFFGGFTCLARAGGRRCSSRD